MSETSTGQEEPVTYTVHGNLRGLRLDQVISQVLPAISTREARQMIMAGNVLSCGVIVRRNYRVREGDSFTVPSPPRHAVAASTAPLPPLSIVYEDDELLVVDKPANVVVHPSHRNPDGTLYDAILAYAASLPHGALAYRPSLVQRLDKNTSGLLLVAKIPGARRQLQRQLARHSIEKGYLALVHGSPVGDSGTVDLPLGHDPLDRRRMTVRHDGQASVTSWRVVERLPCTTLLRVSPRTGRTHQIRAHMLAIGLPIVGDPVYGADVQSITLQRQFLHASALSFDHPVHRERLFFESPLPPDLAQVLARLRANDGGSVHLTTGDRKR